MLDDLKGKRVLITGASTGIGAATAIEFGRLGSHVVVHYNSSEDDARAVVDTIRKAGGKADLLKGDVSVSAEAIRVVNEAAGILGGLDVLINNAGALVQRSPVTDITDELFDRVIDLNVRSVVMASKAAVPHLRKAGGGAIINTSSIAARNGGGPGAGLYASAKAFVSNLTRNMAKEYAADNIRVNAVAPGVIITPFHQRFSTPEMLEAMRKTIVMGRIGEPQECVGAYVFLASPAMSGYITGQVIEVNGGQLMP
ncbi:SDR family NAD(P)-dependent oxidoreductase [Chelatococcus composti]|uniref:3-oxoacyl-[acyl-carrier protein] reductase n=1 Tax=Chelatococcus composti TaxID=1743235 RepID=A0A841K9L1_9HYPH|nr:SDR family oxidoreductase [Chelatococcus composti]MBB6169548.1 3-oxoacyl-[acyl-carrier protein] reductase [Chelatococcus composti]MBS7736133.1 SDR family oxidoreductase [Chelatococcus composti]GGG48584.1 oxidoreductase [Chelatococcus composti]